MKNLLLSIAFVCFVLVGITATADLTEGLFLYLPFNSGEGTVVYDASGNGHDGEILDAEKVEWVDGQEGFEKAINFSGHGFGEEAKANRTGRLKVKDDLGAPKELTISLWFFVTRDSDWNYFMDMRPTGSWFARDDGNKIAFNGQGGVPGGEYPRDEWANLTVLADSSSTAYYINGEEAGTAGGAASLDISTNLTIGSRFSDNESFLSILDEIAFWDRLLSDEEIAEVNSGPVVALSVEPVSKLSTTWGKIKELY